MEKPFWFRLIEQWKQTGRGEYGLTFPFLVGAISNYTGEKPNESLVESVFKTIIESPFEGCYCEVRWCGNINEPVASVKALQEIHKVSIKSLFKSQQEGLTSLAFTTDLMSMFNLNCKNELDCLNKLIAYTTQHVLEENYSKNGDQFTSFTGDDLEFITLVKAQKNT